VADPFGRSLSFTYNSAGQFITVTDPAGGVITYAYTTGRLVSVTYPGSVTRSYLRDDTSHPYAVTGIVDENGATYATLAYDSQGRAISTEHAGGAESTTVTYGSNSATVTDALGGARVMAFSAQLGASKNTGISGDVCPGCGPAARTFDTNGNPATRTDWNGNRTNYSFDSRGLETQRVEA